MFGMRMLPHVVQTHALLWLFPIEQFASLQPWSLPTHLTVCANRAPKVWGCKWHAIKINKRTTRCNTRASENGFNRAPPAHAKKITPTTHKRLGSQHAALTWRHGAIHQNNRIPQVTCNQNLLWHLQHLSLSLAPLHNLHRNTIGHRKWHAIKINKRTTRHKHTH